MTRINVKIRGACETEINGKGPDIGPAALALLYNCLLYTSIPTAL